MSDKAKERAKPVVRTFRTQSGVNPQGEPFIQLIHDDQIIVQLETADARTFATGIIEAAEAAEQDAFLMEFMQKTVGLDFNRAGHVILEYRQWREKHTNKRGGPTSPLGWTLPDSTPKA
jgi:hypothetical protein